jgi:hypothetical protein
MTDVVGPVKAKPQTRAKWRGVIKVTRRSGMFYAESRDGVIDVLMVGDEALHEIMVFRKYGFFNATVLGDGTLMIKTEVGRKRYYTEGERRA